MTNGSPHAAPHGALVIFGSGPGIGVHVASRFARGGFDKVVLLSRNHRRLSDDAFLVYSNAPQVEVSTIAVDLTVPADLDRALQEIEYILAGTPIECIHYGRWFTSHVMCVCVCGFLTILTVRLMVFNEPSLNQSILAWRDILRYLAIWRVLANVDLSECRKDFRDLVAPRVP